MSCPAPRLAASVLGLLYSNRGVNPSVTAYAVPPPFSLREKGGFWTGQLHTVVPLSKRLPLEARGAVGVSRLRGSPRKNRKIMQFETQNLQFRINHRPLSTIHRARNPSQFRARFSTFYASGFCCWAVGGKRSSSTLLTISYASQICRIAPSVLRLTRTTLRRRSSFVMVP